MDQNRNKDTTISQEARIQTGILLRRLQYGEILAMPFSRSMPTIGNNSYELRIRDSVNGLNWRVIYHISQKAIVILDSFKKKSSTTPQSVIKRCQKRMNQFYRDISED